MKFDEFLQKVDQMYNVNYPYLRYGQSIMNVLHEYFPEKYKEISQTDSDCFYKEEISKTTLEKLKKEWN